MRDSWNDVELGEVATIDRQVVEPDEIAAGNLYVGLENVVSGGGLRDVAPVAEGQLASGKFRFDSNHVLFGKLRPNLAKSARPDFHGVCSTDILPIRPGPTLDRDYLAHFIATPATVALATRRAAGANLPRLSPKQLELFRLRLPPLDEQRRIARVLDAADALRQSRARTVEISSRLIAATFRQIRFPDGTRTMTVGELVDRARGGMRTGPFGSQLLHSEFVDSGVPVLGIDNVVANEFRWAKPRYISDVKYQSLARYTVNAEDVLITIMGTCGRTAVVPSDIPTAINTKHLCCITLDQTRCLPGFLHAYFLHDPGARSYLESRAKGAIMSGLNMGIIKELSVRLPSLGVQREFVQRASEARSLGEAQQRQLTHLDALFASLQHRAFTGAL